MSGTIIYMHGFASVGNSPKSQALRAAFPNSTVHSPDLPIDPTKIIAVISKIVHEATEFPIVFVGTSLGGFWANYFAHKFDAPCVLVNPSTVPVDTMTSRIGTDIKNFSTNEPIVITDQIVAQYAELQAEASELHNGALVHMFLAMDDCLLDYRTALVNLPYFKTIVVTADGGHRYDAHWPLIITRIKELVSPK